MMTYRASIDEIGEREWHEALARFSDASIYQTWSYGEVRWGAKALSHLVLHDNGNIVGLAQVPIRKIPIICAGIAYLPWGPLWRRKKSPANLSHLQQILTALHQEYLGRRKLLMRIVPREIRTNDEKFELP